MAERNALYGVDEYGRQLGEDAPVPGAVRNVLDAARAGWNDTQFWTPEGRTWLDTLDPVSRKMLESNAGFVSSVLGAGNALYRGAQQAVVEGGNALDRAGVPQIPGTGTWSQAGRDFASLQDAFMGSPHSLPHVDVPGVVTQARSAVPAVVDATNALLRDQRGSVPLPDIAPGVRDRISTRVPTAKGGIVDPHTTSDLTVGLDSSRASGDAYAKNADIIKSYPDVPTGRLRSPDAVSERLIDHVGDNLVSLYDQIPPEIAARSMKWYDGANAIARRWADQFGQSVRGVSGVLASLSPQKDWFQNVNLANRVLDINANPHVVTTPDMMVPLQRFADMQKNPTVRADMQTRVDALRGRTLGDISDPLDRALWVRAFDEAHNPRGYPVVSPEGDFTGPALTGSGAEQRVGWGSFKEISKALSVLGDDSLPNISRSMGGNHKVRNFYNNIISPNAPMGDVTIDTHAIAAGHMRPLAGSHDEVANGLGLGGSSSAATGSQGLYGLYAEAYRRAAERVGILPRQMQSVTWEGIRGLFSPEQKRNAMFTSAIDDLWHRYGRGQADASTTRSAVHDAAGGINPPEWWGSGP